MIKNKHKVAVGMSGGVDSSVSALLLRQQGYDVVGLFMKLWHDPCGTGENACCDEKALADAHKVAAKIGIPLYVVDVRKEFKEAVTDYFIDEYKNCRTPNPCVVCNKKIKFGWLLEFAEKIECDYLATGHYARIASNSGRGKGSIPASPAGGFSISQNTKYNSQIPAESVRLLKAKDLAKDQSYFLYRLSQEQLSHVIFPLGEMTKDEVRLIAKKNDLPVYEKKESQEICFVENDYRTFLKRNLGSNSCQLGEIIDTQGNIIGHHDGLINYTVGQRKGIDQKTANRKQKTVNRKQKVEKKKPLYVIGFDKKKNRLIVGEDKELYQKEFTVEDVHWIKYSIEANSKLKNLSVKIRYKAEAVSCTIEPLVSDTKYLVMIEFPVRAVTPGQSAVFYQGDEVVGGGRIV